MTHSPLLNLGAWRQLSGAVGGPTLHLPTQHLTTHGVVVGMTGSGKTGLLTVLAEEALAARVPTLIIDVKGDLPNLLLGFSDFSPLRYEPWLAEPAANALELTSASASLTLKQEAVGLAQERMRRLKEWGFSEADVARYVTSRQLRVITPGATAGESLHLLSPLELPSQRWQTDVEGARAGLSAAVSLVLRLLGRDADPARSKEHVLLSHLAERYLAQGQGAALPKLVGDVLEPPVTELGALPLDAFISANERGKLAAALNALLASSRFSGFRKGEALDVGAWLAPGARTPGVIVSVAHLDDEERELVLGMLFEELLNWVRSLPGSQQLRALVVFDEVYGFMPPHPRNPATKRPLVALMKQARAFGVGLVVATQNPMDLDYRALGNAGLWCVGRLQTEADRERVLDGLTAAGVSEGSAVEQTMQRLADRWFIVRNAHASAGAVLLQPRYAHAWLRGPMTRSEIAMARRLG